MRLAGLVLGVLCGCTQLFSLEDVETSDRDLDADGVLDVEDNCKGTANPDQGDVDGDNVGDLCDVLTCEEPGRSTNRDIDHDNVDDGCDPCPLGFNDDEDGDGWMDACDRCPGYPDSDQADDDKDGIGNACEEKQGNDTKQQRVFFDGFGRGTHDWIAPGWQVDNGALAILPPTVDASVANAAVFGKVWQIEMAVDLPAVVSMYDTIQILLKDTQSSVWVCAIDADFATAKPSYHLRGGFAGLPGTSVYLTPGTTAVLRVYPDSPLQWVCEVVKIGSVVTNADLTVPLKVRVAGQMPDARIRYIDVTR